MSPRAKKNPVTGKPRRPRGTGGVAQRSDGLWVGWIELPRDPMTGARRRKQVTHKTYDGCVAKLDEARLALKSGATLQTKEPTLDEWLAYWFERIAVRDLRPTSIATYVSCSRYAWVVLRHKKLSQITVADVRAFHDAMDARGLAGATQYMAHGIMSRIMKDAVREEYLTRNVFTLVKAPAFEEPEADALSDEECMEVLRSIAGKRNASRWAFGLLTGARQGECLGLRWEDVDFDNNVVSLEWQLQRIAWKHGCETMSEAYAVGAVAKPTKGQPRRAVAPCGHKLGRDCPKRFIPSGVKWEHERLEGSLYLARPKTKASRRDVHLNPALRELLWQHWLATKDEPNKYGLVWTADRKWKGGRRVLAPLTGQPVDPATDRVEWDTILRDAGVRDVKLHDMRHTAITLLYELGIPEVFIQQIVGQTSIKITRGYRKKDAKSKIVVNALDQLGTQLAPEAPAQQELARLPEPELVEVLDALQEPLEDAA